MERGSIRALVGAVIGKNTLTQEMAMGGSASAEHHRDSGPRQATAADALSASQRAYFLSGVTRPLAFRLRQLERLGEAIRAREPAILAALRADLGKPAVEAYASEVALVLHAIAHVRRHLRAWAAPRQVRSPLILFPATSWIQPEPYGRVLLIAPWNYPFQLSILPLVGALAAGNCTVVKPSEMAPQTARLVAQLCADLFDPAYCCVIEGGHTQTQALLAIRFDYLFFTGSTTVGRQVMAAAAPHLTPLTLELGGKNPCIVDADADLDTAVRRIAWGKFLNAGQTCVAPDFLWAHRAIKAELVQRLGAHIQRLFGADPLTSPDYGRIINTRHVARLAALLQEGDCLLGGQVVAAQRYVAPTLIDEVSWNHPAMQEEIFGPILPVLSFTDLDEVIARLQTMPKPLALYYFSRDRRAQARLLMCVPSGGAAINDTFAQLLNARLPFGGVGESGMGAYHGKASFMTFSHDRSVVRRATWADPGLAYPPYRAPVFLLRRLMRFLF